MSQKRMRGEGTTGSARSDEPSEHAIAVRAYSRWLDRGCPVSDGLEDWFAARNELEAELSAPRDRPKAAKNGHRVKVTRATAVAG